MLLSKYLCIKKGIQWKILVINYLVVENVVIEHNNLKNFSYRKKIFLSL